MTPGAFAARHPVLHRLAARGAAEGVRRHGLLPAAALARLCGIALPAGRRPAALRGALPDGIPVQITDNAPLSLRRLAAVLDDGLSPEDWMAMLNDRVFFWVDRRTGLRNLAARRRLGYESEWHRFDARALLAPVWPQAEIAPINTGATVHRPPRRGRATFAPLAGLDYEAWRRRRRDAGVKRSLDAVQEVVVRGGVPRAGEALLAVEPA